MSSLLIQLQIATIVATAVAWGLRTAFPGATS